MSVTMRPRIIEERHNDQRSVPVAELTEWRERYGLVAGITLRGQGFSLGLWSDDPVGAVFSRWRTIRTAFRTEFTRVVLAHQVHGTTVQWHDETGDGWLIQDGIDGHATGHAGVLLTVTVADCVPVFLVDPSTGNMALLHAGWRGIADGVVERGIEQLAERSREGASSVVMHCGVGICGECYEVGPEVVAGVLGDSVTGPSNLDLRAALVARGVGAGIKEVTVSAWCSAHDEDFFSHRRSRGADGRMVAYLGRPLA